MGITDACEDLWPIKEEGTKKWEFFTLILILILIISGLAYISKLKDGEIMIEMVQKKKDHNASNWW